MKQQVLITADEIAAKVEEMGARISQDYHGKNLLVISLLRGSFIFTADLVRHIHIPVAIEFLQTSSYGAEKVSSGQVNIVTPFNKELSQYDVLLVDDILDTGCTMKTVYEYIQKCKPKSLKTCTLLDKPSRRVAEIEVDYKGFIIEDRFVAGYGLNYGEHYRNTPYIFEVLPE
ncbi:hypoxanthine phosphoribosyltransferase [Rubeoparvulum massiliense]|uniref:hypoxanthine phosphoribosyltransferase n=1 Tax=Rubeoparvulum massiliense TaxID=1631346 RepID=UPI00065E65D6|nr:hypoxanthine phosphoribosyltransferase [Rubeoparvulum massiliense]